MPATGSADPPNLNPVLLQATGEFALLIAALRRGDYAEAERSADELARLGYRVSVGLPDPPHALVTPSKPGVGR